MEINSLSMLSREGEFYEKWATNREAGLENFRQWARALGGTPPDDGQLPRSD